MTQLQIGWKARFRSYKILKHNFLKRAANRLVRGILILVVDKKLHLGMDR